MRDLPAFLEERSRRVTPRATFRAVPGGGRRIPGEAGLWVFLLGDMTLFGLFFVGFVVQMSERPTEWRVSANLLHDDIGTANTIMLLVSSYVVARSVSAWHSGAFRRAQVLMLTAACLGVGFGAMKLSEYLLLMKEGISPTADLFFTYYFALTGIHLLHVVIGVVILLVCARRIGTRSEPVLEGSASYWHMVDVLWVVLFPLLYFVGRV